MAIDVTLFKVAKRLNSTYAPPESNAYVTLPCNLKEKCGVVSPIITLASSETWQPTGVNYCKIPAFDRFYWITEWEYDNGLWTAYCKSDPLATWRDTIGTTQYYVTRCSKLYDGNIIDNAYPFKNASTTKATNFKLFNQEFNSWFTGAVIVTIVGADGALSYLQFDVPDFELFCSRVFTNVDWLNLTAEELADNIAKLAFNPFQYVVNVIWIPFTIAGGTESDVVKLGYWEVEGHHWKLVGNLVYGKSVEITTSAHPDAEAKGDFLNHGRFNQISLFSPMFGSMPIDSMKLPGGGSFTLYFRFDARTGQCEFIARTASALLGYYTGMFGVPVQIAELTSNPLSALVTAGSAVLSAVSGNVVGALNGVGSAVNEIAPDVNVRGAQGSTLSATDTIVLFQSCLRPVVEEDKADIGRPLCKNKKMSEVGTGFYIVNNGTTSLIGATPSELAEVKATLESGVYYS